MTKCNCSYCRPGRWAKHELQHGGTDWETDYDEPVRMRTTRKRKRNVCAKSKTGEPCDRLGRKVKGTKRAFDFDTRTWKNNKPNIIECCSRCGREHWWSW